MNNEHLMQADVIDPAQPCRIPNVERMAAQGVVFSRPTSNPVTQVSANHFLQLFDVFTENFSKLRAHACG